MKEIWKDIEGYEGLYKISNLGNVLSIKRNKNLIITLTDKGYAKVNLYKNGKGKVHKVHRLVAIAFIPNLNEYPEVNHIDGDKTNNCVTNLEWCTTKQNCQHRQNNNLGNTENARKARMKPIYRYDLNTGVILEPYDSSADAAKQFGCSNDAIARVVRGERKSYKGFGWKLQ